MTRGRVAVVNGPVDDLRAGWGDVCVRWGRTVDLEVTTTAVSDEDALLDAVREADLRADGVVLNAGAVGYTAAVVDTVRRTAVPVVHVATGEVAGRGEGSDRGGGRLVHGRGFAGYFWALRLHAAWRSWPGPTEHYGDDPAQVGDLRIPTGSAPSPTCVLLHGGFWREAWGRDTMAGIGASLAARGWLTWNVGYRRLGPSGGGWPQTWRDVAAAIDRLPEIAPPNTVDPDRVVFLGHSAGAALAVWAAARKEAPVRPAALVSIAGLLDLRHAAETALGDGATVAALGEPDAHPDRYDVASPVELVPIGVPTVVVHGAEDEVVPPATSATYEALAAAAGDELRAHLVDGADHFEPILPDHAAWEVTAAALDALIER